MDFKYLINSPDGEGETVSTETRVNNTHCNVTTRESLKKVYIIIGVGLTVMCALFIAAFVLISQLQQGQESQDNKGTGPQRINFMQLFLNTSNDLRAEFNDTIQTIIKYVPTEDREFLLIQGWHKASENLIYKEFSNLVSYRAAKSKCKSIGGRLIAEALRNESVIRNLQLADIATPDRDTYHPWIGYDDIAVEGNWTWSDGGETNNVTVQWDENPPSPKEPNGGTAENCGHLRRVRNGVAYINDIGCRTKIPYLCEKKFDQNI